MTDLYDIPLSRIDGTPASLGDFRGKVLLAVNVASACGLTPQYEGLERLYKRFKDRGLEVLGFPANEFGAQEPGSNEEIAAFCTTNFGVDFPMFAKIVVKGEGQHDLYRQMIAARPRASEKPGGHTMDPDAPGADQVRWNFEKFLIGRDGAVVGRFAPDVGPEDAMLVEAIETALG
jgi:glutathione peroxidase